MHQINYAKASCSKFLDKLKLTKSNAVIVVFAQRVKKLIEIPQLHQTVMVVKLNSSYGEKPELLLSLFVVVCTEVKFLQN